MKIDLILDSRLSADELALLGSMAEEYGINGIWTASYLDSRDPFANLVLLARATRRIRLGPVAVNPWDIHPLRIATGLLTLNELADGRAAIVVGGGGEALQALGIRPEPRVGAVRECVEILKASRPDRALDYAGRLFRVKAYRPAWATATPPPIFVAANKPQMLRMAARAADGIMMSDLPPGLAAATIERVRVAAAAAGRDAGAFMFSNFMAWHVHEDRAQAVREARQWLGYRGLFRRWVITAFLCDEDYDIIEANRERIYAAAQMAEPVVPGVPDRILDALVENLTLTGDHGDLPSIIGHLRAMQDAGLTHVALELRQEPARSIRLIGEKILPAIGGQVQGEG
ncbi:MAG: LLM class flavin-dependent oxidoreductase [Chromatiales bacterium]|nr:LLM class flavin-dependent oxidoreductase [Chromatiales bacterium]